MNQAVIKDRLEEFLNDEAVSTNDFNNHIAWSGNSIEARLSFLEYRALHTAAFLAWLATEISGADTAVPQEEHGR